MTNQNSSMYIGGQN